MGRVLIAAYRSALSRLRALSRPFAVSRPFTPLRIAPSRSAPEKSASDTSAPEKSTRERSAPLSFAPVRSAPVKRVKIKTARVRFACFETGAGEITGLQDIARLGHERALAGAGFERAEVGAREVGAAEVGARKIRLDAHALHDGAGKSRGIGELRGQVRVDGRAEDGGAVEVRAREIGADQDRPVEPRGGEVGALEIGCREVGSIEVGVRHQGAFEIERREIEVREVSPGEVQPLAVLGLVQHAGDLAGGEVGLVGKLDIGAGARGVHVEGNGQRHRTRIVPAAPRQFRLCQSRASRIADLLSLNSDAEPFSGFDQPGRICAAAVRCAAVAAKRLRLEDREPDLQPLADQRAVGELVIGVVGVGEDLRHQKLAHVAEFLADQHALDVTAGVDLLVAGNDGRSLEAAGNEKGALAVVAEHDDPDRRRCRGR